MPIFIEVSDAIDDCNDHMVADTIVTFPEKSAGPTSND
jgi:hypothetical protein